MEDYEIMEYVFGVIASVLLTLWLFRNEIPFLKNTRFVNTTIFEMAIVIIYCYVITILTYLHHIVGKL